MFALMGKARWAVGRDPKCGKALNNKKGVAMQQIPTIMTRNWMISVETTAYCPPTKV